MKKCTRCKQMLPLESFSKRKTQKDGLSYWCKSCTKGKAKTSYAKNKSQRIKGSGEWRRKNRERYRTWQKKYTAKISEKYHAYSIKKKYGVSAEAYKAMLESQGGACGCCGAVSPGGNSKRFHVDHDHTTKWVRGLLCARCNFGMGVFEDSPALFHMAAHYLARAISAEAKDFMERDISQ